MLHMSLDVLVIILILIHLAYLRKVHLEDVARDLSYTNLINEHIDKIDEHIKKLEDK